MYEYIKKYTNAFLGLLYPEFCVACNGKLYQQEDTICTKCMYNIPRTNFHKIQNNIAEQIFWGRVNIEKAVSFFYFHKESKYQQMIHKLKYKNQKYIGEKLGQIYGSELIVDGVFNNIDYIIPVPLHTKRQYQRGYNQSEQIAVGLKKFLKAEVLTNILYRKIYTTSQTRKHRYERWKNIENVFGIKNAHKISEKNILLVDDILTTGATIESCINTIVKNTTNVKINILTIAISVNN